MTAHEAAEQRFFRAFIRRWSAAVAMDSVTPDNAAERLDELNAASTEYGEALALLAAHEVLLVARPSVCA